MILTVVSWCFLGLGVATALAIAMDVRSRPQHMWIMNVTWPITGLYFPVVGWWLYARMGRPDSTPRHHTGSHGHHHASKPKWQSVFVGATHCGGGCVLGDCIAAPIMTMLGITVLGSALLSHFIGEFIGAYLFGIAFQFLPLLEMGETSPTRAFIDAIKADTLSLVAFEIGMFGWIALSFLVLLPAIPSVTTPEHWFMMQIAMIFGFATSYPANWWLIRRGIKHGM